MEGQGANAHLTHRVTQLAQGAVQHRLQRLLLVATRLQLQRASVELGDEVAISAADMFAFESEDKPNFYELSEYINEHSFDLQRYFSTLCLVYGSNPKRYPKLLNEIDTSYLVERQEFCIQQYHQTNQSWHTYLKQP